MSNELSRPKAGTHLTRKQAALLVTAGLGSFWVAFVLQGASNTVDEDLVMAVPRDQRSKTTRASFDGSSAAAIADTARPAEGMPTSASRMNRMVVRDPFGLLAPEAAVIPEAPSKPPIPTNRGKNRKPGAAAPVLAQAPPGPPPPPSVPVAPALPFTAVGFIHGKKIGDGQQQTFIQQGENLTVIRQGDTINGAYRVDDINAERILFTYLPLGQKQSLPLLDKLK